MNMQFLLNASPQNTQEETIFSVNIAGKTYINASGSDQKIEIQGISFKIKPSNIIINTLKILSRSLTTKLNIKKLTNRKTNSPASNNKGNNNSKNIKKRFLFLLSAFEDCNSQVSKHKTDEINR